jgi:cysteinyl-tRNA synthetase
MARGAELARIWMHNGMLQFGEEKMAKSVGNIVSLADALERWGAETLLMLFVGAHYRQPLAYDDGTLEQARARVARVREGARGLVDGPSPEDMRPHRDAFFTALADDFNTAGALGPLFDWVREANRRTEPVGRGDLVEMLGMLGLERLAAPEARAPEAEDRALLERRQAARAGRDYAEADRLRDALRERGWEVRDGAAGAELVPAER